MVGAVAAGGLAGVAISVLPPEVLTGEARTFMWGGVVGGALSGSIGNLLVARGGLSVPADPRDSRAFLRAIVLDFALQVFAVVGGTVGLFLLAVKFANLAAFGFALAGVATVFRVAGTVMVSRALNRRALVNRSASSGTTDPRSLVQDSNS